MFWLRFERNPKASQNRKTTALVDTDSQVVLDVHCTTEKRHDTQIGWQVALRNAGDLHSLAADKSYNWQQLRDKLREEGVRPLIKHREFREIVEMCCVYNIKRAVTHPN